MWPYFCTVITGDLILVICQIFLYKLYIRNYWRGFYFHVSILSQIYAKIKSLWIKVFYRNPLINSLVQSLSCSKSSLEMWRNHTQQSHTQYPVGKLYVYFPFLDSWQHITHLQCLMLSEKDGSGMAFFRKFNMDFSRAALWGKHCTPTNITHQVKFIVNCITFIIPYIIPQNTSKIFIFLKAVVFIDF